MYNQRHWLEHPINHREPTPAESQAFQVISNLLRNMLTCQVTSLQIFITNVQIIYFDITAFKIVFVNIAVRISRMNWFYYCNVSQPSSGSVAEWSKALDLGSSHFDGVGSNPTAAKYFLCSWKSGNCPCFPIPTFHVFEIGP